MRNTLPSFDVKVNGAVGAVSGLVEMGPQGGRRAFLRAVRRQLVGVRGFEPPAPSVPKLVLYQAELHSVRKQSSSGPSARRGYSGAPLPWFASMAAGAAAAL